MKFKIILIIFLASMLRLNSQNYEPYMNYFFDDKKIIQSEIKSKSRDGYDKFIILFIPYDYIERILVQKEYINYGTVTMILYSNGDTIKAKMISKSYIFKEMQIDTDIFKMDELYQVGCTIEELKQDEQLKDLWPMSFSFFNITIAYYDSTKQFYYSGESILKGERVYDLTKMDKISKCRYIINMKVDDIIKSYYTKFEIEKKYKRKSD